MILIVLFLCIFYTSEIVAHDHNGAKIENAYAQEMKFPLFKHFPLLQDTLAHITLTALPTPIEHCTHAEKYLNISSLYVKRDDLSGGYDSAGNHLFGGNKIRKLEFLLADALKKGKTTIITFGCAGSNHALATTTYARKVGLHPVCMLKPQHNSHVTRRNLLLQKYNEAELHYFPDNETRTYATALYCKEHEKQFSSTPYIIPTGGSCPLGVIGFVNAAFELKKQIDTHIMPEPDIVYVPVGSMGTLAGLALGLQAAQLKTKIIGVVVEPVDQNQFENEIMTLIRKTNQLLSNADPSFINYDESNKNFVIHYAYAGNDYALFTWQAVEAKKIFKSCESIQLDGVYSGKACAALIDDARNNMLNDKTVLFWHTFSDSDYLNELAATVDYHQLPEYFHHYFIDDVQELDR